MIRVFGTAISLGILSLAACSAPAWESSFTEDELRTAVFNETRSGDDCFQAAFAGDRAAEVRAICAADMEEMRQSFEFELIECTPEVPQYSGLSGPALRSAEVCLVKYKHIERPASVRAHAQAEAEGRSILGGRHIPEEVRISWIVYRVEGVPTLHKHLN